MSKVRIIGAEPENVMYKNGEVLEIVPTSEVYANPTQLDESDNRGIWVRCQQPGEFFGKPVFVSHAHYVLATGDKVVNATRSWAEMTEHERDVLVAKTLGWEVVEVSQSRTFLAAQDKNDWYPVVTFNTGVGSSIGWLEGVHWTREGHKIHYAKITRGDTKEKFKAWHIPRFSADRAAAMTLLDGFERWSIEKTYPHGSHFVVYIVSEDGIHNSATHESLPEAICLAFLRAKGVDIK